MLDFKGNKRKLYNVDLMPDLLLLGFFDMAKMSLLKRISESDIKLERDENILGYLQSCENKLDSFLAIDENDLDYVLNIIKDFSNKENIV